MDEHGEGGFYKKRTYDLYSANVSNSFGEIRGKSSRFINSFFPDAIASRNILLNILMTFF